MSVLVGLGEAGRPAGLATQQPSGLLVGLGEAGRPAGLATQQPSSLLAGPPAGLTTAQLSGGSAAGRHGATRPPVATLLGILARASSPAERIAGGWLRPTGDPAVARDRLGRWSRRIADGRPERVAEILDEHGFTLDQWHAGLGDVTAVSGEPLPPWARDAITLFDLVGVEPGPHLVPSLRDVAGDGLPDWVDADQPWRFHPGFRDWMAAAAGDVDTWTGSAPISEMARRDMVLDLARRQLVVSGPLLMQTAAIRPSDDPLFASNPRGDWESLWSTHPVVARLLATVWRQWRETTAELCHRIAVDLPVVCPGVEVIRIELSAGDQHCGGRGVARVRLSDGTSVFLKPRSDGLHRVLASVLDRVDAAGTPLGIGPAQCLPEVIERDGYAWIRHVPSGDCPDDAGVDAYFRRAGSLLRVLQAMGATDLHHENFVPTEHLPVLVDIETVVGPGRMHTAQPDDVVSERWSDTPGPTSMVTSVISGPPGRTAADIGALAGPLQAETPYAVRMLVQTDSGPELRSTRAPLANGRALPTLAGCPVALRGHEQALIDGYADAQHRLESLVGPDHSAADHTAAHDIAADHLAAREIAASDSPAPNGSAIDIADLTTALDTAAHHSEPAVRFVARPTRIYARLLLQSTAPVALVDGVEREFVLELLYRATGTAPPGLIACEAEAMRDLDVPLFTVPFTRTDLVSDRGVVLPNALTQAPDARTRQRLCAVAAHDEHVDDLRATLFAMDPDDRPRAGVGDGDGIGDSDSPVDRGQPLALVLDRAIEVGDGTLAWIGLEHDPNRNRWTYGRLGAGLTGQAGIGLALAVAAPAADAPTGCQAAARAALLGSVQRIGPGDQGAADAFGGPAGVLYATAVAARLLNDAVLLDAARSLIDPCLVAARRGQPSFAIDGAAGAILALLHLPDDPAVADALTELAELAGLTRPSGHGLQATDVDAPDSWSASLPSRAFGIALARHRLARIRPPDPDTPGGVPQLPIPTSLGDQIACATVHPPDSSRGPVPATASLRELLDHAVLAQAAVRSGGGPAWAARRDRVVDVIVTRRARTGRWAAPLIAPDATLLSGIHGMAALSMLSADLGPAVPIARALT